MKGHFSIFQHLINIKKNYTAHPDDMVHIPAVFRGNTAMSLRVTARKRKRDRQTHRQRFNITRPWPFNFWEYGNDGVLGHFLYT